MRITSYSKGEDTQDLMNCVISKLTELGYVISPDDIGFQVCSEATCDFELHVVKKRKHS